MARARLDVGARSNITVRGYVEDGKKASGAKRYRAALDGEDADIYRANCRYRAKNGYVKQAESWGPTANKAEKALNEKVTALTAGATPSSKVTVESAANQWLTYFEGRVSQGKITRQTYEHYKDVVSRLVVPNLGGHLISQLTTGQVTAALDALREQAPSSARAARVVLKHITTFAKQHDWIRSDPMENTDSYRLDPVPIQVMTDDQIKKVRQAVDAWQSGNRYGPKRGPVTLDVLDFMLGTGCRPGEALALRWEDVDLGETPTVTIAGTIVSPRRGKVHRQAWTKTKAGYRTVTVPPSLAALLMRRAGDLYGESSEYVFPARGGGIMSPNNFRRGLREALRQADLEGFFPYLLRKKNATEIADKVDLDAAAANLGHSNTAVTRKHYADRPVLAPDVSATTEALLNSVH